MSTTTKAMPVEVAGPVAAEQSAPGRSRLAIGLVVALTIAYTPCAADSHARLVADYDNLTAADRAWLRDLGRRAWTSPGDVTEAERQRADRMEAEHLRVGVFVTPRICGE